MTATDEALAQLNALLDDYSRVARKAQGMTSSVEMEVLANRLQAAIGRLTPPTSSYAQAAAHTRPGNARYNVVWGERLAGVATALRG